MPYRRKYRKRRYRRSNRSMYKTAERAIKNYERKNVELHSHDNQFDTTVSGAGVMLHLTPIVVGDLESQRTGDEITLKSFFARLYISPDSADTYDTVRYILFRWFDETTPTVASVSTTDILQDSTVNPFLSPLNRNNSKHMQVLLDRTISVNLVGTAERVIKIYKKMHGKVYWKHNSTTKLKGHLYMALISDSSGLPHPQFRMNDRIKFIG